ncbi:Uncharacterised protein [Yersinia pseudotuberculosis]|uniref:Uncharacterized protein n=1 Tax=Yersinia pseudotuberculosis TaxID=633 RepID=A0A380Q5I0_YERPU|nr:Uncharacterised protein [Yersinia pseudotuberculosis]
MQDYEYRIVNKITTSFIGGDPLQSSSNVIKVSGIAKCMDIINGIL